MDCSVCGNTLCEPGENACRCAEDCDPRCDDQCCSVGEDAFTCDNDCASLADFAIFQKCFSGVGGGVLAGCEKFDYETDGDVDSDDYREFFNDMPFNQYAAR
jgi:hypothetical protein